jgi:hypothetical protein
MKPAKRSEPVRTINDLTEREEQIRRRAYKIYETRGLDDGRDVDDWLQAEAEILGTESRYQMTPKMQPPLHAYAVKIEIPTGRSVTLPNTLLTPKQVEQIQLEFKRTAHETGVKGARITVQRIVADDFEKVMREVRACLRTALAKAA